MGDSFAVGMAPTAPARVATGEAGGAASGKRRRRGGRGRRRREGGTIEAATGVQAAKPADKAKSAEQHGGGHERPRLLGKITQGFKAFMNRFRGSH